MSINRDDVFFSVERDSSIFSIKVYFSQNDFIEFFSNKMDYSSNPSYVNYINNLFSTGGCTDVQPINGVYQKRFIKNLFKNKSVSDLSDQLKYLKDHKENKFVKVFVLDIKDSNCSYNSIEDIKAAEKEVETFFLEKEPKEKSPRKDIYKMLKANDVNYFFCEGRLKADLISQVFSAEQSEFFQKTDEGKKMLCQISEIILDAFKVGYEINVTSNGNAHKLLPSNYLILFNNKEKLDVKKNNAIISPTTLFTLYPNHYKELYSIKEKYCESLSQVFRVDHNYDDETKTTSIGLRF